MIRQAFDNFMVEQTSDEILRADRQVRQAVGQSTTSRSRRCSGRIEQVAARVRRADGAPAGASSNDRCGQLEAVRRDRNLAIDGELFDADVLELEGYRDDVGA